MRRQRKPPYGGERDSRNSQQNQNPADLTNLIRYAESVLTQRSLNALNLPPANNVPFHPAQQFSIHDFMPGQNVQQPQTAYLPPHLPPDHSTNHGAISRQNVQHQNTANRPQNRRSKSQAAPKRKSRTGNTEPVQQTQHDRFPRRSREENSAQFHGAGQFMRHRDHSTESMTDVPARNFGERGGRPNTTGNDRCGNDGRSKRQFFFSFNRLEELTKKEPEEIVMELANDRNGFANKLEEDLTGDYIVLIIRVLAKMCSSAFNANKATIMMMASRDKFMKNLLQFVMQCVLHDQRDKYRNKYFWNDMDRFWYELHEVCSAMIDLIPTTAITVLPKLITAVGLSLRNLEAQHNLNIRDELKLQYEVLEEKLCLCIDEMEKKELKKNQSYHFQEDDEEEGEPPDDFRDMSVYPMSQEITNAECSFVRKNKIEGGYRDVDQYLDIQFRLLREDFVAPLRQGVCDYVKQSLGIVEKKKIFTVRVHPVVRFVGTQNVKDAVGLKVQFDLTKQKQKKKAHPMAHYYNLKRFMYGALVCFTRDQFQTLIFGQVIDRDPQLLDAGQVVVKLNEDIEIEYEVDYTMVECNTYFEPYYHVLKALQNMDVNNFPMERYIVHVDPNIQPPKYLKNDTVYHIDQTDVSVCHRQSWPSARRLRLNDTQYKAFQAALTDEFAIIQGPPGTGKTYLGLKIVKTLLLNKKCWYDQTPILIVCYTNHALDQFVEGLIDTTLDIVRIGSQSKNESMKQFSLNEVRRRMHQKTNRDTSQLMYQKRQNIKDLANSIKQWNGELDALTQFQVVADFRCFQRVDPEFERSWFANASRTDVKNWLLGGRNYRERKEERRQFRIAQLQEQVGEMDISDEEADDEEYFDAGERKENKLDIDFDEEFFGGSPVKLVHLLDLKELNNNADKLRTEYAVCAQSVNPEEQVKLNQLGYDLDVLEDEIDYITMRLEQGKALKDPRKPENVNLQKPHDMMPDDRWLLYFYWLKRYIRTLNEEVHVLGEKYREILRQYEEIRNIEDCRLMKQLLVVSMTTTGAARLQTILQALQCRIVVVEEAAEVLESHIIAALTKHCQHLILIGDHQQLRPTSANFQMETKMHLGVSLFERMVKNDLHCSVLGVQHRMRPEISKLIRPAIYPELIDHESVLLYPPVRGIDNCLYFINHAHPEKAFGESSKQNPHEAAFLIRLAHHLILNGYEPHEITILVAYQGQWCAANEEKKRYKHLLQHVRLAVLDNYQGEECKIILLSLVRNNKENSIGFLRIENRVCVALSRAKEGFYIMGNMELLCANSKVWPRIKEALVEQNCLGEELTLRCCVHQDKVTKVKCAADFDKTPEGGCNQPCGTLLMCGHICKMICHVRNRTHSEYKCKETCKKVLCEDVTHICLKYCYLDCGPCAYKVLRTLLCGHQHSIECHIDPLTYPCPTLVLTELSCGHKTNKPCHIEADKFRCPFPCEFRIESCGHSCTLKCHIKSDPDHVKYMCRKPCAKFRKGCTANHLCPLFCYQECPLCEVIVKKQRTVCPHVYPVRCSYNVDDVECTKPCAKSLPCGHKCKSKCNEKCGLCKHMVDKLLPECNHYVKTECSAEPDRKNCKKACPLLLPCGHRCNKSCNEPCTTKCMTFVKSVGIVAACRHTFDIPCYLKTTNVSSTDQKLLQHCKEPCNKSLICKHKCAGTCGGCVQGRLHKTCAAKCGSILVCGHECTIPCRNACKPCTKKCSYRCPHAKCSKRCGDPCAPCKEPCSRRCKHVKCIAFCGENCTVDPCTEPCMEDLSCGHACVGFCGDPCPPLCRICDKEELQEIFFGTEDEEDARFVLLKECGHVVESDGMDAWLQQKGTEDKKDDAIAAKTCPKCKTPLASTQRYSDYIKQAMNEVIMVKLKFVGTQNELETKRLELHTMIERINEKVTRFIRSSLVNTVLKNLEQRLQPLKKDRRQNFDKMLANAITAKLQLTENIVDVYCKNTLRKQENIDTAQKQCDLMFAFLIVEEDRITDQEIQDVTNEINRLERMMQLYTITETAGFQHTVLIKQDVKQLYEATLHFLSPLAVFTDTLGLSAQLHINELNKKAKAAITLSDAERREIVKAVGLKQGHWYKCPNGHPYAIADCGGAMEEAKCYECGAKIGGRNHTLTAGNAVATEMDGARHAAWSEAANMANYDLRNF